VKLKDEIGLETTIEDIILENDKRTISNLRPLLEKNYCEQAAELIISNPKKAIITTGFFITGPNKPETDGPSGAIALGNSLESIGFHVTYVTDEISSFVIKNLTNAEVIEFPITNHESSKTFSKKILHSIQPSILISIERCGFTLEKKYKNMAGLDISENNAKIDYLFKNKIPSIGIGDGGNEIGMGNLKTNIPILMPKVQEPCVTQTSKLIISSVSNWGGYGLIAALSIKSNKNLLPSLGDETIRINKSVELGAVDGFSKKNINKVDSFTIEENINKLEKLHQLLKTLKIPN